MNYKIIINEDKLKEFIDWLPELKQDEKYYLCLFARKKYCEDLIKSNDKTQLKRFTSDKSKMLHKIKQLQCEVGSYKLKDIVAPQESLVLYITPNPRNMRRATFLLAKQCMNLIENNSTGYNIHAESLSCIQKSKSKSHFCDFDIDDKNVDLSLLQNILPKESYNILETRGGYHILVNTNLAPKTKWHKQIIDTYKVDQIGDQMIPVPGCTQGGFVPKFL